VRAGRWIVVVEGEKAADRLFREGFIATCGHAGAGNWHVTERDGFRGARVVVLADNDEAGRNHARDVACSLEGFATVVKLIGLPGLPDKGDAFDWLEDGHTADELRALVDEAPEVRFVDPPGPDEPRAGTDGRARVGVSVARAEDGAGLLDDVATFIRRHVVLSDEALWTVAAWVAHAHAVDAFYTTPRLNISSPEAECGKTMLLVDVMGPLLPDPIVGVSISPAALYRVLADRTPPILIDELDNTLGKKGAGDSETLSLLLAILNSGYRRGQYAWRCIGTKHEVHRFPTFAPAAFAGIAANLTQPFVTRAIGIPLERRRAEEQIVELEWSEATTTVTAELNARVAAWAAAQLDAIRRVEPERPAGMTGRLAECWVPLAKVARVAGGAWPERLLAAFAALTVGSRADNATTEHRLLVDLHEVFGDDVELHTTTILARLNALEDSPWGSWNDDKGIKAHELAKHTKRYRTHAKTTQLWIEGQNKQGYKRAWFEDAWTRYLPLGPSSDPESPRTPRTVAAQGIPGEAKVLEPRLADDPQPLQDNASRGLVVCSPNKGPRDVSDWLADQLAALDPDDPDHGLHVAQIRAEDVRRRRGDR
jgi:hypothetical protein